jgi:hypothetical protein
MLTRLVSIKLLVLLSVWGHGQVLQSNRLEIPIDQNEDGFQVTSVKTRGIVLYRMALTPEGEQLQLIHTDTAFQFKWSGYLPFDKNFVLANQAFTDDYLYFIFYKPNFSDRNFHLYQLDLKTGNYVKSIIKNSIPFAPNVFAATEKGILIGGYFSRVPVVIFYNIVLQQRRILPGLFNEPGELNQIKVNPDNTFDLIISSNNYEGQRALWIKNYDPEGRLLRNSTLKPGKDVNFIFAQTVQTEDNQIVAGVYGKGRNKEYSRGLFVADVSSPSGDQTQYYSFIDLENFFKYMRANKEKRTKEKFARKKIKGKKIRFQYRFIVHEFVPYKDYFLLLGEAFYPKYKRHDELFGGALVAGDIQIFDGYQYTHAVLLGISKEGKLLWDNSFEMNDIKTFTLQQFVKMDLQEDAVTLLYLFDNKIRTKIIKDSTVLEGKTYSPAQQKFIDNNTIEEDLSVTKLDYWYTHHFLTYGVENKVITTRRGTRRSKVFFVNKVHYAR